MNTSESSLAECSLGSCPPIDKNSSLYIIQGANIPSVVIWPLNGLEWLNHSKNLVSLNCSGSIPQSANTFSGPSGCNGGSILVNDTIVYLATIKLGDEVLKNATSEIGDLDKHEGIVVRDPNIYVDPFKITGSFIIKGLGSKFKK